MFSCKSPRLDWNRPTWRSCCCSRYTIKSGFIPFPHFDRSTSKAWWIAEFNTWKLFSYWYHFSWKKKWGGGPKCYVGKPSFFNKMKERKRGKFPSSYYAGLNLIHLNMNSMSKVDRHHMFFGLKWFQQKRKTHIELI